MLHMEAACCFHPGNVRGNNEDNFAFGGKTLPTDGGPGLFRLRRTLGSASAAFGLFDGMGGLRDGEVASRTAARTFLRLTRSPFAADPPETERLLRCCAEMNAAVCACAAQAGHLMGTTCVLLLTDGKRAAAANVGDSRAYRFREGTLTQLSQDHSDRALLEKLGARDRNPSLLQYLGVPAEEMLIEPFAAVSDCWVWDRYLLCSDGLTGAVPDSRIAALCGRGRSAADCAAALTDEALRGGGGDNITVIVCDILL